MPPFSNPVASIISLRDAPKYPCWLKSGAARTRIISRVCSPLLISTLLLWPQHYTCRCAMRVELAIGIGQAALRRSDATAYIDDLAFAIDFSGFAGHWTQVIDLQLEGGIARSGRERRLHRTAHG